MTISRTFFLLAIALSAAPTIFAQSTAGRISGTVIDSVHNRPLAGATIIATPAENVNDSVFHSALSDVRGRFRLDGLRAGRYTLTAEHPYTDSIGIGALPVQVDVPDTGGADAALAIPSAMTLRRALCQAAVRDTTLGIVVGAVRRLDRSLVAGASIVVKWSDFDVDRQTAAVTQREHSAVVVSDSSGVYRACGVPVARTLFMQAQLGTEAQTGVLEMRVDEAGVLVSDLTLADGSVAVRADGAANMVDAKSEPRLYSLPGRIVSAKGEPIVSAQVRLFGGDHGASTNDAGEFRLNGLPGGTQGIEVLALGYVPRRLRVEIGGDARPLTIKLEKTTVVLDSIRVIAKRMKAVPFAYKEFEHRRANGFGRFIGEDEIENRHAFLVSDVMRMLPGIIVGQPDMHGNVNIFSSRPTSFKGPCKLKVFIDGMEEGGDTDVNSVPPEAVHGIEVHNVATAPVKYHVGACGAVFIWTK